MTKAVSSASFTLRKSTTRPLWPVIILSAWLPSQALQGGPTMPEYVKFEPADITDIVNLNTGDFTYSIPLGDVPGPAGGFPLSMSYHAGVGHNQEATWVGLGWTLNPGAINRMLRGYPDDIHNSATFSYVYSRSVKTGWGVNVGAGYGPVGLNMTYDTDKGFGGSLSLSAIQVGPARMGVDVGTNGVDISAQMMMTRAGVGIGREGITGTFGFGGGPGMVAAQASMGVHIGWGGGTSTFGSMGLSITPVPGNDKIHGGISQNFSSSHPSGGGPVSIAGTGFSASSSASGNAQSQLKTGGFGLTIPFPGGFWASVGWNHYEHEVRISEATAIAMYGYMYQGGKAVKGKSIQELTPSFAFPMQGVQPSPPLSQVVVQGQYSNFIWKELGPSLENMEIGSDPEKPGPTKKVGYQPSDAPATDYWMLGPSNDVYSASGPGMSGSFRPYGKHNLSFYQVIGNTADGDKTRRSFFMDPDINDAGGVIPDEQSKLIFVGASSGGGLHATAANLLAYTDNPDPDYPEVDYYFCLDGHVPYELAANAATRQDVADLFNALNSDGGIENDCSPYAFLQSNIRNETNRLVVSADDRDRYRSISHTNMRFGFLNELGKYSKSRFDDTLYWTYGGRQIIPLLEEDGPGKPDAGGRLKGFKIIDMDGKQYLYEQPVYSLLQIDYSTDQAKGIPTFARDDEKTFSWSAQLTPYATQWLLSEVRGADFIEVSKTDMGLNYGYHVKLEYTEPVPYNWRSPYAVPNTPIADLPNIALPERNRYVGSMGQKELVYLKAIETATHRAVFNLNDEKTEERRDFREWKTTWLGNSLSPEPPPIDVPITLMFEHKGETFSSSSDEGEWEGGWPYSHSPTQTHLYDVAYESKTAYIPIRPAPSQVMALGKMEISHFSAAYSYFADHDCEEFFCGDVEFSFSGPGIARSGDENGYQAFEIESIEATSGEEERFGPYKVTFVNPIGVTARLRDILPANANRNRHKGKVYIGPNSYWEMDGALHQMKGRLRGNFDDDYCDANDVNWDKWNCYAERLAPIPPKMNIVPWYEGNRSNNQARYLKSIDILKKENAIKLRSFNFAYDYSLCGRTPNSYPKPAAPAIYPAQVSGLSGKLTLLSVQETGYDLSTGEPGALPPFELRYQEGGDFFTGGNPDYYNWSSPLLSTASAGFTEGLLDSYFKSDPWGLFNPHGSKLNQKIVNQSNKGVTWNLEKIINPLGGVLHIGYERDQVQDQEYHFRNGTKAKAFIGSYGGSGWDYNLDGDILISPFTRATFNSLWANDGLPNENSAKYFENLTKSEAEARFTFAEPSYPDLVAGDSILIAFKASINYKAKTPNSPYRKAHMYFPVTSLIHMRESSGRLHLSVRNTQVPDLEGIFRTKMDEVGSSVETYDGDNSGVLFAAVYEKRNITSFGGDVRVASLTSCFADCRKTAYEYAYGGLATRPDSVMSSDWITKILFTESDRPRFSHDFLDYGGFRLGKSAIPSRGAEYDLPFLPSSSISYGSVTVANINPAVCMDYDTRIQGCITNGKTEYGFWTPNDFGAATAPAIEPSHPHLLATTAIPVPAGPNSWVKLKYDDYSSILGKPKSITYFGSEWVGGTTAETQFHMISKDSLQYQWVENDVNESWDSERRFGSNGSEVHKSYAEHTRRQARLHKQIKYQFVKKELGVTAAADVDHLESVIENGTLDPLTGTNLVTKAAYRDTRNPSLIKIKETESHLMSSLGATAGYSLPKEMKRRNLLSQPLSEKVSVYGQATPSNKSVLDYKLFVWGASNPADLRTSPLFKRGEMTPTFKLPAPGQTDHLGNPETYYSSGYDLSKWKGSLANRVDKYSRPEEIQSSAGTLSSNFIGKNGADMVGFILNAGRLHSQAMTFNGEPDQNRDWQYQDGGQFRNGSFLLPMGPNPPVVSRQQPTKPGDAYTITFRAKTRAASTSLAVDFFARYPVIVFNQQNPIEWRTAEGPQQNFTITTAWTTHSFTASITSGTYPAPPFPISDPLYVHLFNQIRFFVDDPASLGGGIDHDVLIDFITIAKTPTPPTAFQYGEWILHHGAKTITSNRNAIYSSASGGTSALQVPLNLNGAADLFTVEFSARANEAATALEVDFLSNFEGDQKRVLIGQEWKKYRITLDRRLYSSSTSYPGNWLRFFCDSQDDREIEIAYARAYPQGALASSFVHDARGNMVESIDENFVSTYYSYDKFGRLKGVRNGEGFVTSEQAMNYGKK